MIFEDHQPTVQRVVHRVLAAMKDHIEKSDICCSEKGANLPINGWDDWLV
jgi:hypothetical protein